MYVVNSNLLCATIQAGKLKELRTFLVLLSMGVEEESSFFLSKREDSEGKTLSCALKNGLDVELFSMSKGHRHNRTFYVLPSKAKLLRFFRKNQPSHRINLPKAMKSKPLVVTEVMLSSDKEFRKGVLMHLLECSPGKHYVGFLASVLSVTTRTVHNYVKELPINVCANYIRYVIEGAEDMASHLIHLARFASIQVKDSLGKVIHERNIGNMTVRAYKQYVNEGYKILARVRTANTFTPITDPIYSNS